MKRMLVIDDEAGHRLMIRAVLEETGWEVNEAGSGEEGLEFLEKESVHAVLLDRRMPGMDGQQALERILALRPGVPVVMLTAFGTVGSAVEAMKQGAFDYLTKPADNDELVAVLERAYRYGQLVEENEKLRRRLASGEEGNFEIIGDSGPMRRLKELVAQAGPSEATVLISGESGTGKELVAEALHRSSHRAEGPLVKVNCAALPDNLLESELFGYVKGAFTGAMKDKPGRFQLARGGTLFLDEIGEMPQDLQAKLLRALQERVVEPLGSVRPQEVDVRIIAATNRDLRLEVAEGRFREDLFFRLNVLEVEVPPLRRRLDDLPALAGRLLSRLAEKNRRTVRSISPAFLDALARYSWPGNVRELENVIERALILSRSDTLGVDSLPGWLLEGGVPSEPGPMEIPASLDEAEKQALVRALDANGGHRQRTADSLGISRRTLQYKLRKYGLTKR